MPLPLIPPFVPPAPAEVALLSSTTQHGQPEVFTPAIASCDRADTTIRLLAGAEALLPLEQVSRSATTPFSNRLVLPSPRPQAQAVPQPEIESDLELEVDPEIDPEVEIDPNAEVDPDVEVDSDAEIDPGPEVEPGIEAAPSAPDNDGLLAPSEGVDTLLLRADRQTFEPIRQILTATGDVLVQFGTGQLAAERLWVNLNNRYLRAEGNVFFNRNNQIIEGESATYNLLQGSGNITESRGELQISTLGEDFSSPAPGALGEGNPLDYRLQSQGSISQVMSPSRIAGASGNTRSLLDGQPEGLRRLRFESEQFYFNSEGWYAEELRLTNDPFSPPELEFRANNVRLTPLDATRDELVFDNPRLVLDQWLSIPILRRRYVLERGQLPEDALNPLPTGIGIDGTDRGGLFVERELPIIAAGDFNVSVAPQFLISRWLGESNSDLFNPANFGLIARADGPLGPRTSLTGVLNFSGLDLRNFRERLRANFRVRQMIGTHRLNVEYSYRDRLFNGSLGFQDVQNSVGLLLESPNIVLGSSGINLSYQASGQYVTATTDDSNLLSPGITRGLASLYRFQGAINLGRSFVLWRGQPLPATPTEGLRYSDRLVVPNLVLGLGLQGVATYYTSDDSQQSLEGRVSLAGQLGHLQRNIFDYTQFNIGFSSAFVGGEGSPFFFDRVADKNVLSGGIIQQVYGPFLAGFQTSLNINTGVIIDTNLIFEYRRRAYGLLFTYSPQQELGFVGFRISTFDWVGRPAPFDADPATPTDVTVQ